VDLVAVVMLGLSAGALLAEARLLVPMWRAMPPASFLAWYREHAALLLGFFGPLEIVSTVAVLAAATLAGFRGAPGAAAMIGAALLALVVLATFPLYFQRANASFADGSLPEAGVAAELVRWSRWHNIRVAVSVIGFGAACIGFAQGS